MNKKLIKILLLIVIFLPSYANAGEIGIEGIKLGDSLLDFYSEREIKKNDIKDQYRYLNKQFNVSRFKKKGNNKSFKKYDANISAKYIFLNEIKTSTANIEILSKLLNKKSFIQIEDFIKQELS